MKALAGLLAPTGRLRAAINLGNPLFASRGGDGQVHGVSVDLARELARQLDVPADLVVVDTAAAAVAAVTDNSSSSSSSPSAADVGFFAVDPARGESIAFTAPYLLIEGCYLVRQDSPVRGNADVDQPGRQVVVGKGSAYDLYLSRTLRHAGLVRAPSSQDVVALFLSGAGVDNSGAALVAAGVRQQLEMDTAGMPGLRLLEERFMTIAQAMGVARQRGPAAAEALHAFVETMKAQGFIGAALARHGVTGAALAPLQS